MRFCRMLREGGGRPGGHKRTLRWGGVMMEGWPVGLKGWGIQKSQLNETRTPPTVGVHLPRSEERIYKE